MKRDQLEHIIRASAAIAGDDEIVIVGSQCVLGQFPDAPTELLISDEADVFPMNHPDRADLIDGSIGELSTFHDTAGYYGGQVEVSEDGAGDVGVGDRGQDRHRAGAAGAAHARRRLNRVAR